MVRRRRSAAGDLTENPAAAKERSLPLSRAATTTAPIAPVFRFPAGNQSPVDRPVGKGIRRNIFCDDGVLTQTFSSSSPHQKSTAEAVPLRWWRSNNLKRINYYRLCPISIHRHYNHYFHLLQNHNTCHITCMGSILAPLLHQW